MSDSTGIPSHIGYIVDGNRRWAKKHGLPAYEGHLAGYNALKEVAIETIKKGVHYVSVYVFSTENWKRSEDEVHRLMNILLSFFKTDLPLFQKENVRLQVLGSREGLRQDIINAIDHAEKATEDNTGGVLGVCFNYGGHQEIVDAVKVIIRRGVSAEDVTTELIEQNLYAPDLPPVDLIVRTSGEERISNFMLWRAAYSEFLFLEKAWPDMRADDVQLVIDEYSNRSRRFGG